MKIAKVSPIFKNGERFNCNNYRSISVLSVFSKILQKIFNTKILNFIESKNLIFKYQYGFCRSKNSELAVTEVITDIIKNVDNDNKCCLVSLDLCKAFDTVNSVNHQILLKHLYNIGISGLTHKWLTSYLDNRQQYVQINGVRSRLEKITCGVPQGSIMGPILFIIYINSISSLELKGNINYYIFW